MKRTLSRHEEALLADILSRRALHAQRVLERLLRGERLGVSEANVLRDAVGNELMETGVDPTVGAVNERGRLLDDLIDHIAAMSELHQDY